MFVVGAGNKTNKTCIVYIRNAVDQYTPSSHYLHIGVVVHKLGCVLNGGVRPDTPSRLDGALSLGLQRKGTMKV